MTDMEEESANESYLTVKAITKRLAVHKKTVYRWIDNGELKAVQFGREFRIAPKDFQDFLTDHQVDPHKK